MKNLTSFNEFLNEANQLEQWVVFIIMKGGLYKKEAIVNSKTTATKKANKILDNLTDEQEGSGYMTLDKWEKHVKMYKIYESSTDMKKFKPGQKIKWAGPKGEIEDEIKAVKGVYLILKSGGEIPYQSVIQ